MHFFLGSLRVSTVSRNYLLCIVLLLLYFRRLQEAEDKNRDLLTTVARREEALHQNNVRLTITIAFGLKSSEINPLYARNPYTGTCAIRVCTVC